MTDNHSPDWFAPPQKRGRRWRRHLDRLGRAWTLPPERRVRRLIHMLEAATRLDEQPSRRAEVAYLLGCHYADAGEAPRAARMFECAYHDDDAYVTASVLVFACLKRHVRPDRGLLEHALESWRELRQPTLLRWRRERQLLRLAALPSPETPAVPDLDATLQALRLVPIRRLRDEIDRQHSAGAARPADSALRAAGP
jgi:hypothetical protein